MNKPSLQLSGVPTGCVRRALKVSVHVGGDTANTRVRVGRRTVKRTTSSGFTVTVPVSRRSRSGRLSVVASNDAGTARARASFRASSTGVDAYVTPPYPAGNSKAGAPNNATRVQLGRRSATQAAVVLEAPPRLSNTQRPLSRVAASREGLAYRSTTQSAASDA